MSSAGSGWVTGSWVKQKPVFRVALPFSCLHFLHLRGNNVGDSWTDPVYSLLHGKMWWDPPQEDGSIYTKYQKRAHTGKFLECQLESAPQAILQVIDHAP